jgi:hypothetical protein
MWTIDSEVPVLLQRVEAFMKEHRIPPARFGRDAMGDPCFVFDLRDGREPRRRTIARVDAYLASARAEEMRP